MKLASAAATKRKSTVSLVVTTRDGKKYDLGVQKNYGLLRGYYRWRQSQNIKKYYSSRLKTLTDPKEIEDFTEQIEKLRVQLKGETNG